MAKALLNYTTKISTDRTVSEIHKKLAEINATSILTDYEDGIISAVSFRIKRPEGLIAFKLPANIEGVYRCLENSRIPRKLRTREQASKVAWRIIKDWLEAQIAMIEAEIVDVAEVFLPYAIGKDGKTMYETLEESQFKALTLKE